MIQLEEYINLDRRFRDLTKEEEIEPSLLASLGDWEHAQGTPWKEVLESERVVLLAEAGSGKTRELQAQAKDLVDQGKLAFSVPIEALDKQDLRQYLASEPGHAERFEAWLINPEGPTAWFFLDSVDELKLVQGKLEYALLSIERRDLAMACGDLGRVANVENILSQSGRFLLKKDEAKEIVDSMVTQVQAHWYSTMRAAGVSERDCELLKSAFVYPGFLQNNKVSDH